MMLSTITRVSTLRTAYKRIGGPYRRLRLFGTGTYYDSQSGMEVPLHDEDTVSLYLDTHPSRVDAWDDVDIHSDMGRQKLLDSYVEAHQRGIAGARLPKTLSPNAKSLAASLASTAPGFTLFVPSNQDMEAITYPDNVNLLFDFSDSSATKNLPKHLENGTQTSVGLFDNDLLKGDPIDVASRVVSLMDKGGCDFVWLCCDDEYTFDDDDSDVLGDSYSELAEELTYLDVVGPTVKSRLVISADTIDEVQDCLDIGVNKFVLSHKDKDDFEQNVEWLQGIVEERGKRLVPGQV